MIYTLLLLTGVIGYAAMMVMGMAHGVGHHGGHAHHGGDAIGHGHGPHATDPGGHHTPAPHHGPTQQNASNAAHAHAPHHSGGEGKAPAWMWLSPFNLFSLAIGAGLTGFLLDGRLNAVLVAVLAFVGAVAFNLVLVRPLMGFLMRFESTPSAGLEGTVAHTAKAETGFDKQGKGVVTVMIDGQISRMLAHLPQDEGGVLVRKGDELVILEVDPRKGSCIVTTQFREDS